MKGPLVTAFRSPLMRALDRSVETLCLCTVTSLVTFIKSLNQSSIKLCQKRGFFSQEQPKFILQIMSIYISCRSIFQIMSILWYILYFFSCSIRNFQVGTAEKQPRFVQNPLHLFQIYPHSKYSFRFLRLQQGNNLSVRYHLLYNTLSYARILIGSHL